jgi:ParB family chromosome partitioning protein
MTTKTKKEIENAVVLLGLDQLVEAPFNPRKIFDEVKLGELAESIRTKGVLNPLLVRPVAEDGEDFEILAGARRFRAARIAGLDAIPCLVREVDDEVAREICVIDNLQRADVSALEEAAGFQILREIDLDVPEIARRTSVSERYVYDSLALLENLAPQSRELLEEGLLTRSRSHGIELARRASEVVGDSDEAEVAA